MEKKGMIPPDAQKKEHVFLPPEQIVRTVSADKSTNRTTEELQKYFAQKMQQLYEDPNGSVREREKMFIREKTDEELRLLNCANEGIVEMQRSLGLEEWTMPPARVLMVHTPKFEDHRMRSGQNDNNKKDDILDILETGTAAGFSLDDARILMNDDKLNTRSIFAGVYIHEAVHASIAKNLGQLRAAEAENIENAALVLESYKCGIRTKSSGRRATEDLFLGLNEAITEELASRIFSKTLETHKTVFGDEYGIIKDKEKEFISTRNIKGAPDYLPPETLPGSINLLKFRNHYIPALAYRSERSLLWSIIGRILEESKMDPKKIGKSYSNKEELFQEFVKAAVSGNVLHIGKLIERSLGKGSLKKIALDQMHSSDAGPLHEARAKD